MSLLPCHGDLGALGLLEDGRYWDLDALREHVRGCRHCTAIRDVFAAVTGAVGGANGRGTAKRRGSSAYYSALASRRVRAAR